ncbi:MAG: hypothetical protein IEMM0002_1575 [bacterium]|nr:MAG: hypothetical protein IEMM0002_1575 [bacterium]
MTEYPLHLIDEVINRKVSLKSSLKANGMPLSEFSPARTAATKKMRKNLIKENPWKTARQKIVEEEMQTGVEESVEIADSTDKTKNEVEIAEPGISREPENSVSKEEPAESSQSGDDENITGEEETQGGESPDEDIEKKPGTKPMTIMEVFMATKKSGGSTGKKSSSASNAMIEALKKQEKSSKTIEKMVSKNVAAETSRKKPESKVKKPLADIVSEIASKADKKKEEAAKSKQPNKTVRRPATVKLVTVPVEGVGSGVINTLGDAAGGVVSGVKKASAKVQTAVSPAQGKRGEGKKGAFDAALNTATRVTGKVADGITSIGSGAATVAGYTVKGAVGIVSDTAGGILNLLLGPKKKKGG